MKKFIKIIDILILTIFYILTIFLITNIIKLANIENLIRIIIIIILLSLVPITYILKDKKKILYRIIALILSLIFIFLNYTFYKVYNSLDNITVKINTKVLCLVTNDKNIKTLKNITDDDIGILSIDNDKEFYELAENILIDKELDNKLIEYEDYIEIINSLLQGNIKYAFLPKNYEDIYNAGKEEITKLDFNVLHTETKTIKSETNVTNPKSLDEPFSILLIGTDVILDSYNADTLMLLTVNPKTLKITMLSIPRDTYTSICNGGKHKINASGWYGDKCVVKTLEKYLDIDINYYAKINFFGVVELVDKLGGIEVDVPYSLCEQNSRREFGNNMIFVAEGKQTLNGEQALALSRNRHYWKGMCPEKYTTDGDRSDLTRGENQQLVIKALINKMMTIRDLTTFYSVLDTVSTNMTTDMPKETILSFYNVGKDILKRLNKKTTDEIINVERLTFKSHFATVFISGLDLSMIVNYNESIKYVSNQMKKNLGLIKEENITNFSFDINEEYSKEEVKFNSLTSTLKTLPNFVGKKLLEAKNYCAKNGLTCQIDESNIDKNITSQSISPNTDISLIKAKTITFEIDDNKEEIKNATTNEKEEDKKEFENNNNLDEEKTEEKEDKDEDEVNKEEEKQEDENIENKEDSSEKEPE